MTHPEPVASIEILGIAVSPMTMSRAADMVGNAIDSRRKMRVVFCNTHTVVDSQSRRDLREAVNGSDIVATDGMPLLWLSRLKGMKASERVYGPDAMLVFCERGLELGWRHYFYGGTEASLKMLTSRLQERFPGLIVAGSYAPPFRALTEEEKLQVIERINEAQPDLVWVGLGMPKQELWMAEYRPCLDAAVLLGVGAAFDFHSGSVKQAPVWMQRSGTEWLYRLLQEPRRLWKRYLIGNTRFLLLLGRELLFAARRGQASQTTGRSAP